MKKTTRQTLQFYLKHFKKQKFLAVISFIGISLGLMGSMLAPIVLKQIIDAMTEQQALSEILFWLYPLAGTFLIDFIGWRTALYSISTAQPRIMAAISKECFKSIHKHSYNFFNNEFVGALVKRVNRMVRSFETFYDVIVFDFWTAGLRLFVSVIVLFWLDPKFGIAMLVWAVLYIFYNYSVSLYKLRKYDLPKTKADSKVTGYLADTISNSANVKLFANRRYENREFEKVVSDWKVKMMRSWIFSAHLEVFQHIAIMALELLMLYWAILLWGQGSFTIGSFVLLQTYLLQVFIHVWHLGRHIRRLYEAFADAEEMTEILEQPIGIRDVKGAKDVKIQGGKIEYKDVHFAYEKKKGIEEEEVGVLSGMSLTIKPSEKVAFIGPSGGGKTTLAKLLLRLFDVDRGEILIDGQNIARVKQDGLRAQIALVPQDPILFHRSLIENIRYGWLDASDEEVIAASKMAHCHEFIEKLPKGYETYVGERGVKLSGGERQRVAIARAILSNARILILDEATSSLDVHSEELIQDALRQLTKNKTTIVIAHRLTTVTNVDRIVVLEDGEIVEEGGHHELLQKDDGLYKALWDTTRRVS